MLGLTTPILSLLPRSISDAATRETIETPNQKKHNISMQIASHTVASRVDRHTSSTPPGCVTHGNPMKRVSATVECPLYSLESAARGASRV